MVESGRKWGMYMFMGEYRHSIDDKGRLIIPSKYRGELGDSFIVTRGLDNCLFVYSLDSWETLTSTLKKLPFTKQNARYFNRFLLSGATVVDLDKQGRINIPSTLTSFASLIKECVVIGMNDHLEIWAKEKWENFLDENNDKLSDIAENLFSGDIDIGV